LCIIGLDVLKFCEAAAINLFITDITVSNGVL